MAGRPPFLNDCLQQLTEAGPDAAPGAVLGSQMPRLLGSADVAEALVGDTAISTGDDDDPPARRLLEALLDEARRAQDDDKPEGGFFIDAAGRACQRLASASVTDEGLVALGMTYYRAGLTVPEAIQEAQRQRAGEVVSAEPVQEPADQMAATIEEMMSAADDDLYAVYHRINEFLASIGDAECRVLIRTLPQWRDARYARLASYWLLDPRAELAQAAGEGLAERARAGQLDAATAGRLAWIRQVLPAGDGVAHIDAALEAYRRQSHSWPALIAAGAADAVYASLPDGVGAQYLMYRRREGPGTTWALVLLKTGYGLRDAYVVADMSTDDETGLFAELSEAVDVLAVSMATADALLGAALAETHRRDQPPPPGLIDVAVAAGLAQLRPRALAGANWLKVLDPEGELAALTPQKRGRLINASAGWSDRVVAVDTWFADDAGARSILARDFAGTAPGKERIKRRLRRYFDAQRAYWAELMFRSALVAADSELSDWSPSLTLTANAVVEDRPIRKIPLMEEIAEATIAAWREREGASRGRDTAGDATEQKPPSPFQPIAAYTDGQQQVLQPFFDTGKGTAVWPAGYYGLHGYLFAIATHPELVPPSQWLVPLLGDAEQEGVGFDNQSEVETVVGALMSLYNAVNGQVREQRPALPAGVELTLDQGRPQGPLRQWCEGFLIAVETFGHLEESVRRDLGEGSAAAEGVTMMSFSARALLAPQLIEEVIAEEGADARPRDILESLVASLPAYLETATKVADTYRHAQAGPVASRDDPASAESARAPTDAVSGPPEPASREKIGRNEPCPCGSGRKYKRCCGNPAGQ